jgi:MoaA/NifB/PqqE/SkfB family radical SAM enzyme
MTNQIEVLARRLLSRKTQMFLGKTIRRVRYEVAATIASRRTRAAVPAMRAAFAEFEPTRGPRERALRVIATEAAQLRSSAAREARFFNSLLTASNRATTYFRPAGLQSYVDVSARVAAVRAFAEYVANQPAFGGDATAVTASLIEHASGDRAVVLAHAALLLDRGRVEEATSHIRRALRMQAVCQTAQKMLARATGASDGDLKDRFCHIPFTHLSTSFQADAFACCCSAWLPYSVGNVIEAESASNVWNSEAAMEIRRSIHDGDFKYCSRTLCAFIAGRTLPLKTEIKDPVLRRYVDERTVVVDEAPGMVQMNHDPSCNLACPSCRTDIITAGPDEQRVYVDAAERVLLPLLRRMEGMTYISGGGEAFASAHYKKILSSLNRRDFPTLQVYLISNGQLLNEKRWSQFPDLPEMIGILSVSIDAARAETYEQLRRPGKWNVLIENLQHISRMRAEGKIRHLQINFVVQASNFREIPAFLEMGTRLGVDSIWLQRLTNYGAYDEPVFAKTDVTSPLHPDHQELLAILRQPFMNDPRIDMRMLIPLLPERVGTVDESSHRLLVRPHLLEDAAAPM